MDLTTFIILFFAMLWFVGWIATIMSVDTGLLGIIVLLFTWPVISWRQAFAKH